MARKRKSDASRLDEIDRLMYSSFCAAANSLSQLYTHAMHKQKLSFQGGERHALEKLYNWILRQQEDGGRVTTADIFTYVQNELDNPTEEPPPSPRVPALQHQQPQTLVQLLPSGLSSNAFGTTAVGQGVARSGYTDQNKNSVFSSGLSSPAHRSLHNYYLSVTANNVTRSNENSNNQTRETNPPSSNDTSMDMHADSPDQDSLY